MAIGIDIVDVKRIAKANKKGLFANKILSIREQQELLQKSDLFKCGKFSDKTNSLAGKFAAKEAVLKALGCGLGKYNLAEIEILHKPSGQPYVKLSGITAKKLKDIQFEISIAHDAKLAIAVAVTK